MVERSFRKQDSGIVNLGFEDVSGETLMLLLDLKGIAVSTGAACNTHSVEPSHVLTAMGLTKERAGSCIRISFRQTIQRKISTRYVVY